MKPSQEASWSTKWGSKMGSFIAKLLPTWSLLLFSVDSHVLLTFYFSLGCHHYLWFVFAFLTRQTLQLLQRRRSSVLHSSGAMFLGLMSVLQTPLLQSRSIDLMWSAWQEISPQVACIALLHWNVPVARTRFLHFQEPLMYCKADQFIPTR